MATPIKTLVGLAGVILLLAFTDKNPQVFIGTYGVSAKDPSQISLTLNSDKTFYYQDFSNPAQKIAVNGNWTLRGKNLVLASSKGDTNFHNVWTFVENGQIAKSRKGLSFYRLCKLDS